MIRVCVCFFCVWLSVCTVAGFHFALNFNALSADLPPQFALNSQKDTVKYAFEPIFQIFVTIFITKYAIS